MFLFRSHFVFPKKFSPWDVSVTAGTNYDDIPPGLHKKDGGQDTNDTNGPNHTHLTLTFFSCLF